MAWRLSASGRSGSPRRRRYSGEATQTSSIWASGSSRYCPEMRSASESTRSKPSSTGSTARSLRISSTRSWGWSCMNSASAGARKRMPKEVGQESRSKPAIPVCLALASAISPSSCSRSGESLARSKLPASVSRTRRVERSSRGAPKAVSRSRMRRLASERAMPSCSAAALKLSSSATRRKVRKAASQSIVAHSATTPCPSREVWGNRLRHPSLFLHPNPAR